MKDFNFIIRQAIMLQKTLWDERKHLTIANIDDPIQVLDPMVIMEYLNLNLKNPKNLGILTIIVKLQEYSIGLKIKFMLQKSLSQSHEGLQQSTKLVTLFYMKGMVYHRDRPLDGSRSSRNIVEIQADRFAAEFLMPKSLLKLSSNYDSHTLLDSSYLMMIQHIY